MSILRSIAVVTAACALVCAANEAVAADPPQGSRLVRFIDLDIAQTADAEKLYVRIRGAARGLCRTMTNGITVAAWRARAQRECVAQAVDEAVGRADHPQLTAAHRAADDSRVRLARRSDD